MTKTGDAKMTTIDLINALDAELQKATVDAETIRVHKEAGRHPHCTYPPARQRADILGGRIVRAGKYAEYVAKD